MQTIRRNLIWVGWELAHNSFTSSATNLATQLCHLQTNKKQSDATLFLQVGVHVSWEVTWFTQNIRNNVMAQGAPHRVVGIGKFDLRKAWWSWKCYDSCETWFFHQNFLKMIYDAREGPADQARHWNPSHPASHPFKLMKMTKAWQGGHAWQGGSVADQ